MPVAGHEKRVRHSSSGHQGGIRSGSTDASGLPQKRERFMMHLHGLQAEFDELQRQNDSLLHATKCRPPGPENDKPLVLQHGSHHGARCPPTDLEYESSIPAPADESVVICLPNIKLDYKFLPLPPVLPTNGSASLDFLREDSRSDDGKKNSNFTSVTTRSKVRMMPSQSFGQKLGRQNTLASTNHFQVKKQITGFMTDASGFDKSKHKADFDEDKEKMQFERLDVEQKGYLPYSLCMELMCKHLQNNALEAEVLNEALDAATSLSASRGDQDNEDNALDLQTFLLIVSNDQELHDLPAFEQQLLSELALAFRDEANQHFASETRQYIKSREIAKEPKLTGLYGVMLDSVPAAVVLLNALTLGLSANNDNAIGWQIIEVCFVTFYAGECTLKIFLFGSHVYFCGSDRYWNWFDFLSFIIALAEVSVTLVYSVTTSESGNNNLGNMALLRILRLTRVVRLVRTLHYKMFSELKAMVLGVFSGLRVLFWAIVLLFFVIYGLGVLTNRVYGDDIEELATVPAAMFTVFRCFTDGCSARDGTPLQEKMRVEYGGYFLVAYILLFMFVTVGIFNLVMAIFIDNIFSTSMSRKHVELGANAMRNEIRIKEVIAGLLGRHRKRSKYRPSWPREIFEDFTDMEMKKMDPKFTERHLREEKSEVDKELQLYTNVAVSREVFNLWLQDPDMLKMLDDVEIDASTKSDLFDVLDVDMGGELTLAELVGGLMRLRGPVTKSDIVAIRLKAAYITNMVEQIFDKIMNGGQVGESSPAALDFKDWASLASSWTCRQASDLHD